MIKVYSDIKILRKKSKISQSQMADHLGIHQSGYSLLENGEGDFTITRLSQIAKVLGVPITYFFDRNVQATINEYREKRDACDDIYRDLLDVTKQNMTIYKLDGSDLEKSTLEYYKRENELQKELIEALQNDIESKKQFIKKLNQKNNGKRSIKGSKMI